MTTKAVGTPANSGNGPRRVARGSSGRNEGNLSRNLLAYLSELTVTQGRLTGTPFQVQAWQRRFVLGAFAEGTTSAALSVARGGGKTTLLSGIGAAALTGPLAVTRGEVILCASSYEQARVSFEHILAFLADELKDRERWRIWDTSSQARIENRDETSARVRCIGSDPRRAHGLAPILVLADEPSQWPPQTSEKMRAALMTAAGKQADSRFVAIGTRASDPNHWFSKMLDGGADYGQVHAAAPDDPKWRKRTWLKANPSLPIMPDLETAIRREAAGAKRDPSLLSAFNALRLNLGVSDITQSTLLDVTTWRRIEGEAEPIGKCFWGVDLGHEQ